MHIHPQLTAGSWLSHSRPEGVTLERYQEFVIMNLAIMCMPYASEPVWWSELTEHLAEFVTYIFIVEMFLKLLGMGTCPCLNPPPNTHRGKHLSEHE